MDIKGEIFLLFLIAHYIGDYYFQYTDIAVKKSSSYLYTIYHCGLYSIPHFLLWIFLFKGEIALLEYVLIIVLTHVPIDMIKCYAGMHREELWNKGYTIFGNFSFVYIVDQLLHLSIIFFSILWASPIIDTMDFSLFTHFSCSQVFILFCFVLMFQSSYVSVRIVFTKNKQISNWYSFQDLGWKIYSLIIGSSIAYFGYIAGIIWIFIGYLLKIKSKKIDEDLGLYTLGTTIFSLFVFFMLNIAITIINI